MAVDPLGCFSSIPGPERPKHQIRMLASRKVSETINSPVLTNPVSRMHVIRMSILREPSSFSLLRREEPILHFRYLIESLGGCLAGFSHNTILQLICRIVWSPGSILNHQLHADFDQLVLQNGSGLIMSWSSFGFVCFQRFTRHTEADPPLRHPALGGRGGCHPDISAAAFSRGRSTAPFSTDPSAHRLDGNSHCCSDSFRCTLSVGISKQKLRQVLPRGELSLMAKLTTAARKKLPKSDFVEKRTRKYPIPDPAHARDALARSSGKPEHASVVAAVKRKFPQIRITKAKR